MNCNFVSKLFVRTASFMCVCVGACMHVWCVCVRARARERRDRWADRYTEKQRENYERQASFMMEMDEQTSAFVHISCYESIIKMQLVACSLWFVRLLSGYI